MKSLAVNGYEAAAVQTALHAPVRSLDFKYELLTSDNDHKSWITGYVLDAGVDNNSLADINRTAKFSMAEPPDINWLSDRLRPWYRLKMPDGGWAEWPLGIFLVASPRRQIGTVITREVEAYDQNLILRDDKVTERFTIVATTNVVEAILDVLDSAGITQVNYTETDETLPVDKDWEPGTDKRKIVNDLLGMINYRSLWFNGNGFAELHPYKRPDQRSPEYVYSAQPGAKGLIVPELTQDFDVFNVPNTWTAVVSEADQVVLSSEYVNDNPDSPTSTVSRDRVIVDWRTGVEATSQEALDAIVQRIAFEASQVYEVINFETALMPHHEDADLITFDHPDVEGSNYVEHTWSMILQPGAKMSHSVRRVVTV